MSVDQIDGQSSLPAFDWLLARAHQRAMGGFGSVDSTDEPRAAMIDQPIPVSLT